MGRLRMIVLNETCLREQEFILHSVKVFFFFIKKLNYRVIELMASDHQLIVTAKILLAHVDESWNEWLASDLKTFVSLYLQPITYHYTSVSNSLSFYIYENRCEWHFDSCITNNSRCTFVSKHELLKKKRWISRIIVILFELMVFLLDLLNSNLLLTSLQNFITELSKFSWMCKSTSSVLFFL